MKKLLAALVVAVAVSFAANSPATAQNAEAAIVKIPFQFIAGGRVLPSGTYRIDTINSDRGVIRIASRDADPVTAVVSTVPLRNEEPTAAHPKVTFVRYRGQYFLRSVAVPGWDARLVILTPEGEERMLAKLNLLNAEPAASAR